MVSRRNERQQIQFSQNAKYWKTLTIEYPHNAPNLKFIDLLIVNLKGAMYLWYLHRLMNIIMNL